MIESKIDAITATDTITCKNIPADPPVCVVDKLVKDSACGCGYINYCLTDKICHGSGLTATCLDLAVCGVNSLKVECLCGTSYCGVGMTCKTDGKCSKTNGFFL